MLKATAKMVCLEDYKVPDYLIESVDLTVDLKEEITVVKSQLQVRRNPLVAPQNNLSLDGELLELKSISLNKKILQSSQFQQTDHSLTILDVPETFTLEIETVLKPQENTALVGLYKSSGNFCTQCEAEGFRRITYFLDRPDVMSRFTTTIIADKKRYPILLSNGNLIASGELESGRHWVKWEDPFKKPSYLFALVAGDFDLVEDFFVTQSGRRVTLHIYVEKGNRDKCEHAMSAVKKSMLWDEEKYGREYDLDIFMIVAVSDFNMGAMENKGLNIFNTKYVLAKPDTATDQDFIHVESVIAHEYFHNWTGNRITCRDWFQLSIKEGLTIFREQSFTADTTSKIVARIHDVNNLRNSQFPEDAGPLAHPVRPECYIEINNFYTATVYEKGAEVIRMMQTILGEKLFRKGMDLYFERHDGQAVTIEDFVKAMEDASKIDLTQCRFWYSETGTPELNIEDKYDADTQTYTVTIQQTCPPTKDQPQKKPLHIPVKIGLIDANGKEILQDLLHVKNPVDSFQFKKLGAKPLISLLRHFSAPVKVNYHYSDDQLIFLFMHDTDLFNRWEAGQKYAVNLMLRLIKDYREKKTLQLPTAFVKAFRMLLEKPHTDKLLLAEMLTLPSEKYLAEQMKVVDVDAIHHVREFVLSEMAKQSKELFLTTYRNLHDLSREYQFNMAEMGKRRLKNVCLFYLTHLSDHTIQQDVILRQFKEANAHNMTDTIAALHCLTLVDGKERDLGLREFYNTWRHDPLVVDKWLSLQAESTLPGALNEVKKLLQHEAFDIKNPNKVYALIGTFCHRNAVNFHAANGEGYRFLAENVEKLDTINPAIAARMVKPLTDWKRYDTNRGQLMREQLAFLLKNKKLSKDVFELVSKSLED